MAGVLLSGSLESSCDTHIGPPLFHVRYLWRFLWDPTETNHVVTGFSLVGAPALDFRLLEVK